MKTNAASDLLEALRASVVSSEVPKGFYTVKQLSQDTGLSESIIRKRLAGIKHKRKVFRVMLGSRLVPVPHYRLV
jgi:hypothetical protein